MEEQKKTITRYLIVDLSQSKNKGTLIYWNYDNHGYTPCKSNAKRFVLHEALKIIDGVYINNLAIIPDK